MPGWLTIPVVGLAAILLLLGDVLFAPNLQVLGDPGDARLCNYVLEHGYRTLALDLDPPRFWNAPFFFPASRTLAYSENLLGAAPLYWLLRALGGAKEAAFQSWLVLCLALDYLIAALWLRFGFGLGALPASIGGVVFGLGSIRLAESNHAQLVPHFYSVLAVWGLQIFFASAEPARARRGLALFFLAGVAQIYASIYLGWFLLFGCGVALLWALAMPESRRCLLRSLQTNAVAVAALGVTAVALLWPLLAPYLQERPTWEAVDIAERLPSPRAWLDPGPHSWIYGGLHGRAPWLATEALDESRPLFFGIATTVVALAGWWSGRRNPAVLLLALTAASLVAVSTAWTRELQPWSWVVTLVPMGSSIRAVQRIALVVMLPLSLGVALFLDGLRRKTLALALSAWIVLEQGRGIVTFDPNGREAILSRIEASLAEEPCGFFFYTPDLRDAADGEAGAGVHTILSNIDAMVVQQRTGIPTVNGYSGRIPPGWEDPGSIVIRSDSDVARLAEWTRTLVRSRGLDPRRLCWARPRLSSWE